MLETKIRILGAAALALGLGLWAPVSGAGENPWPEIRKERIRTLLPRAMERAGVDAWLVVCRENANDPLALHVGGENAGGTAVFLFVSRGARVESTAFSPVGEATALKEVAPQEELILIPSK